jgi:hypothetical protein
LKTFFTFYKTSYLNGEVNGTEIFPSVSVPCLKLKELCCICPC